MSDYGTKAAEAFAGRAITEFHEKSLYNEITNSDYEGEIKGARSIVNITALKDVGIEDYDGHMGTPENPQEIVGQLATDQMKRHYFKIDSIEKFVSAIKDPASTLITGLTAKYANLVDAHILSKWSEVAAGNRIGTAVTAGTVEVADLTGVVTGTGFTAEMVGRGFKAAGQDEWYRVASFTSATEIVIEDALEEDSVYTGGAIAASSSYEIEAVTPLALDASNIYGALVDLRAKLMERDVPSEDLWIAVPHRIGALLRKSDDLTPAVAGAYDEVVRKGYIGMVAGFRVFESNQVAGDNTEGYHVIAGSKMWQTFAMGFTETGIEDVTGDFGKAYKGLQVYGSKVPSLRRVAAAELFCTA